MFLGVYTITEWVYLVTNIATGQAQNIRKCGPARVNVMSQGFYDCRAQCVKLVANPLD